MCGIYWPAGKSNELGAKAALTGDGAVEKPRSVAPAMAKKVESNIAGAPDAVVAEVTGACPYENWELAGELIFVRADGGLGPASRLVSTNKPLDPLGELMKGSTNVGMVSVCAYVDAGIAGFVESLVWALWYVEPDQFLWLVVGSITCVDILFQHCSEKFELDK